MLLSDAGPTSSTMSSYFSKTVDGNGLYSSAFSVSNWKLETFSPLAWLTT